MNDIPATADICDAYPTAQVADPGFIDYGGMTRFAGEVETVRCFEDNSHIERALQAPGDARVLVVDGGASIRCALLGDRLAALAIDNGWIGILVEGCIRDSAAMRELPIGIKALGTHPLPSRKRNQGQVGVMVRIGRMDVRSGWWLYSDEDGVVALPEPANIA